MNLQFHGFVDATDHGSCGHLLRHHKNIHHVFPPLAIVATFFNPPVLFGMTFICFSAHVCLKTSSVISRWNLCLANPKKNVPGLLRKAFVTCPRCQRCMLPQAGHVPNQSTCQHQRPHFKTSSSDIETHWGACRENEIKKHWRFSNDTKVGNVLTSRSTWHTEIKTAN